MLNRSPYCKNQHTILISYLKNFRTYLKDKVSKTLTLLKHTSQANILHCKNEMFVC